MNIAKFYIKVEKGEDFYFVLNSANNRTFLVGQGYTSKQNCYNGIESVKLNSVDDSHFERKNSSSGEKYYFVLKAANGAVIGVSEMYNSKQALENGVEAVKRDAPEAPVLEQV